MTFSLGTRVKIIKSRRGYSHVAPYRRFKTGDHRDYMVENSTPFYTSIRMWQKNGNLAPYHYTVYTEDLAHVVPNKQLEDYL